MSPARTRCRSEREPLCADWNRDPIVYATVVFRSLGCIVEAHGEASELCVIRRQVHTHALELAVFALEADLQSKAIVPKEATGHIETSQLQVAGICAVQGGRNLLSGGGWRSSHQTQGEGRRDSESDKP